MTQCMDCGEPTSGKRSKRCMKCANIQRHKPPNLCIDCGKKLTGQRSKRCQPCYIETTRGKPKTFEHRVKVCSTNAGISLEEARQRLTERDAKPSGRIWDEKWKANQRATHLKSGSWKPIGAVYTHPKKGYVLEKVSHGKGRRNWVAQHRLVMERHLGRSLSTDEHIHHIDGAPANNELDNLVIVSRREHFVLIKMLQFIRDPRGGKRLAKAFVLTILSEHPQLLQETISKSGD